MTAATARKYGNTRVEHDGYTFDSKREAARYQELRLMQIAGLLSALEVHPGYRIDVNGQRICRYVADFRYVDAVGVTRVEDVKGVRTPVFRLKKLLMRAVHGIDVQEID